MSCALFKDQTLSEYCVTISASKAQTFSVRQQGNGICISNTSEEVFQHANREELAGSGLGQGALKFGPRQLPPS